MAGIMTFIFLGAGYFYIVLIFLAFFFSCNAFKSVRNNLILTGLAFKLCSAGQVQYLF